MPCVTVMPRRNRGARCSTAPSDGAVAASAHERLHHRSRLHLVVVAAGPIPRASGCSDRRAAPASRRRRSGVDRRRWPSGVARRSGAGHSARRSITGKPVVQKRPCSSSPTSPPCADSSTRPAVGELAHDGSLHVAPAREGEERVDVRRRHGQAHALLRLATPGSPTRRGPGTSAGTCPGRSSRRRTAPPSRPGRRKARLPRCR